MSKKRNIVFMLADEHGKLIQNEEAVTKEQYGSKDKLERLNLREKGYIEFSNTVSPGASTIQSIESIMSGIYATKAHKQHYRAWPSWDSLENPVLGGFLKKHGYEVVGFSSLFNAKTWLPCLHIDNPDLYETFSPIKRDIYSSKVTITAIDNYFLNAEKNRKSKLFIVHSVLMFKVWDELINLFFRNGYNYDNTIFIITSDHNLPQGFRRYYLYFLARFGLELYHHTDLTEYNTRVIFYLKYPGSKGMEIKTPVIGYDIVPTILDLLGLKEEWPAKFDGISLLPLINRKPVPPRLVRIDNLYPYQIGREQGRITSIRGSKYKYIYRPDPTSSYITYRLMEQWPMVIQDEEFYNIENDIWEKDNLIDSGDVVIQQEIVKHRKFLQESNSEILNFHVKNLRKVFRKNNLSNGLFKGKEKGRMLCFQTCPFLVFKTIILILTQEQPEWDIEVIVKQKNKKWVDDFKGIEKKYIYPDDSVYDINKFNENIMPNINSYYDVILSTSNFPMGDYGNIYDITQFPVGDLTASIKIMESIRSSVKAVFCINMKFVLVKNFRRIKKYNKTVKQRIKTFIWKILPQRVKVYLMILYMDEVKRDKINPELARSIIIRKK
ncbi:MAG: hypothetical protein KAW92_09490 [Candidatus Cloacimonetes bacterium]|nr:hypothetical protein [Candidatus Cloacimonadota bacterium]